MSETTYLVTARKYRPQLFRDVVAQEHVTETLKNAIRLDRLAHAYMFTGPRGVGKTTAARILAKAINCTTQPDEREDGAEPCRTCDSCRSFEEGRNLNIIEIDAASNNSVNDVRELRDTVRIPPQGTRMKVYIVDEVHMLSSQAFNAFLKTLEEPPPHALFIFATTEPHKVIPTIQSRCQRFDFRRITIPETVARLEEICEAEGISADEESLMLIARKGDGALRDALSVFDQAVSLCGTDITYENLAQALGVVDTELYFDVSDAIAAGSSADVIRIVDRVVRAGYDLHEFMDGLSEHFRDLLVARTIDDDSFIHATDAVRKRIRRTAANFKEVTLLRLIHIVGLAAEQLKNSRQPRLHLELALLRMAVLPSSVDMTSALRTLDRLDRMADTGKLEVAVRPTGPNTSSGVQRSGDRAPTAEARGAEKSSGGGASGAARPSDESRRQTESDKKPEPRESGRDSAPRETSDAREATAPRDSGRPTDSGDEPDADDDEPRRSGRAPGRGGSSGGGEPQRSGSSGGGSAGSPEPAGAPEDATIGLFAPAIRKKSPTSDDDARTSAGASSADVAVLDAPDDDDPDTADAAGEIAVLQSAWTKVIAEIMESEKQLGSFLRHTGIAGFHGHSVTLSVPDEFHVRALRADRARLAHRLTDMSGLHVDGVRFTVRPADHPTNEDLTESERDARDFLRTLCEENPAVRSLVERFGGEIVW